LNLHRILVEFAAAIWLVLISINREYRPRNSAITLSVLIFTFVVGLADLLGVNPYKSFWSNYERMEGYITILHLAIYFMILKSVFRTKKDWKIFFNISVAVSVLVSLYAFAAPSLSTKTSQIAWEYGSRVSGTLGNPPFLASYLLLSVFVVFILIVNTQRLYLKFVYMLVIILNSVAIYFSASRGAILAAAIGVIMFGLLYFLGRSDVSGKRLVKRSVLSIICVLIILSTVFLTFKNADFVKHDRTLSRFATMLSDASVHTRFSAWKLAWEGFKEKPLLGWGQENFIGVYTVNPIPFVNEQIWVDRAHNIVIDWLINAGILGLFSYLTIFGSVFYVVRKAVQEKAVSENEAFILATAIAVYFIHNLFTFDTINTYILFFTLLGYIESSGCKGNVKGLNVEHIANSKNIKIKSAGAVLIALLGFCGLSYYVNYKPIRVSQQSVRIVTVSNDSYQAVLKDFENVLSLETFGEDLVRQRMRLVSNFIIRRKLFMQKGALRFIEKTASEVEKEIAANPYNLDLLKGIIIFYMQVSEYEPSFIARTEALIRRCMYLNPQFQWLYMALADVYVLKRDYEGAFSNVKKITDWDPQNDKKQLKLALAAIFISKEDVVSRALESVEKIRMASNKNIASGRETVFSAAELYQLAQVYLEMKNLHKALHYYKEIIAILSYEDELHKLRDYRFHSPGGKAIIHIEIAKIYLALGDKEKAEQEVEKAAELDPESFAEYAEKGIYSLNK
jgi:O-antigen ligase